MDIVNFPGIIAEHGLLNSGDVNLANDLILIGKQMGPQRDGTQYENMAITVAQFVNLVSGGNETLAQTLVLGNTTGGSNIIFSGTDLAIFQSGAFTGRLSRLPLTGNQAWNLPDKSGTIALLSDIPAPPTTLYSGNSTVGANRVATLTDNLTFTYVAGTKTTQFGIGADPFGWGQGGVLNYFEDSTPGNVDAWGGMFDDFGAGDAAWLHEVYNTAGDTAGFFAGYSPAQTNPYSSLYHFETVGGTYRGFEANKFGEQLYSQRLGLVTTALTAADRVLFVSNAGGYLKATTYADLATQLAIPTIYTADGTITSATRNVTINTTLNFLHGAAGVNGSVQMSTGGYFKNQTSIATNYWEYNNTTGIMSFVTDTHTVTGVRAENGGGVGNPTSLVELFAGSNGTAYMNIGSTTSILYFLTNNTAITSGMIYGSSGAWGIGGFADHTVSLSTTGKGNTAATASQKWTNLSGTEYARMLDSGGLGIGTNSLTGGFANASRLRAEDTVSTDYTNTVVFNQTYSNTVNNSNTVTTFSTQLYKATAFNTGEMKANFTLARNDGSGSMNYMYGVESMIWTIGNANIGSAFAYSARVQGRDGTITNWGGLDISYQEVGGGTITNMIGVLVRTPVNVSGGAITNTYGMMIQANTLGTNNYGYVSAGQASNGFGTITPSLNALTDFSTTTKAPIKLGGGMTSAQASALTAEDSMVVYVTDTNGTFISVGFWGRENGVWIKL